MALSPKTRRRLEVTVGNSALAKELADSVDASIRVTSAPINLYVEVSGSDTNPATPAGPYRTIQAAINTLPKLIQHPVTINVGIGNFTGFSLSGFRTMWDGKNAYGSLFINGTLVPTAGLVSGTNSGTGTAGTTGQTVGGTVNNATIVDSLQNWVVDALKGKVCQITNGVSFPTYGMIVSNTATSLTVAGNFFGNGNLTVLPVGSTYQILDFGTVIDTATPDITVNPWEAAQNGAGVWVTNCNSQSLNGLYGTMGMFALKVTPQSGKPALKIDGPAWFMSRACTLAPTAAPGAQCHLGANAQFITSRIVAASGQVGISIGFNNDRVASGGAMSASLVEGGTYGFTASNGVFIVGDSVFLNQTVASIASAVGPATFSLNRNIIKSPGAVGIGTQTSNRSDPSATAFVINGCEIDNCATGIVVDHRLASARTSGIVGTGNTTGISVSKGASFKIDSGTAITGTTEISIDGTGTTLAAVRAAAGQVLPAAGTNAFGSIIFQ